MIDCAADEDDDGVRVIDAVRLLIEVRVIDFVWLLIEMRVGPARAACAVDMVMYV